MQKFRGIALYWLLCVLAISSSSLAANEKNQPELKVDIQHIYDVYYKILYFDSLEIKDSLFYYVDYGYSMCNELDLNTVDSKKVQLTIAEIYYYYGGTNYFRNEIFESINGYEKAIEIFKKYDIKNKYADCLTNLATNFSKVGQEPKALELMHKATSIFIDLNDSEGIMIGYRSIGLLYKRQKDYVRSHEYLNKALKISKETDDVDASIYLLISIAVMHYFNDNLEEALPFYQEALKLSELTEDELVKANVYSNFGEFYKNTGDFDNAKIYFDKAIVLIDKADSDYKRSFMFINYSDYYYLKGDYQQAILFADKALSLSEKIKNKRAEYIILNILLKIYEKLEDTDKLALYQKRVIEHLNEHKDQLNEQINQQETVRFKLDKQKIIAENKQDKHKLDQEHEDQERNYFYLLIASLFVILLTFSLIIYFRLRTMRAHNKYITKQSEERKILLQEVHHRVKNNFQIVSSMLRLQSYSFEDEVLRQNLEEAVNRINAMAIVHNVIYRQEKFRDIDAKNYLERLVENLHKTGDSRIIITIESEEIPFKIETLINLGIALNELITNSFKHAFNEGITQPKINISLRKIKDKNFELRYKDNGVGFSEGNYKSSFGMELIDTIISNYEGEVVYGSEKDWNTVIVITFEEE